MYRILLPLFSLALATAALAGGDTPIQNAKISGTSAITGGTFAIQGGTFTIQTGVSWTANSGSTLSVNGAFDASGATSWKAPGTITTATNTSLIIDANGTGKLDIRDTITTGTNANLVIDANGTGKLDLRDTITTGTNADLVVAPNGTGKLDITAAPLKAGTATAGTAPLKFTSGTNLTSAEAGAIEYDGSFFYATSSTPTRQRISTDAAPVAIASSAIDWSLGSTFTKTLGANTTFTMSNATDGRTIVVAVTNTASNYTVSWTGVTWSGGTPPVQTIGAKTDVYTFVKIGSVIYASVVQNF